MVLPKSDLLQRSDLVDKEVIYCKFGIASNWLLENFVNDVALMDHVDALSSYVQQAGMNACNVAGNGALHR